MTCCTILANAYALSWNAQVERFQGQFEQLWQAFKRWAITCRITSNRTLRFFAWQSGCWVDIDLSATIYLHFSKLQNFTKYMITYVNSARFRICEGASLPLKRDRISFDWHWLVARTWASQHYSIDSQKAEEPLFIMYPAQLEIADSLPYDYVIRTKPTSQKAFL